MQTIVLKFHICKSFVIITVEMQFVKKFGDMIFFFQDFMHASAPSPQLPLIVKAITYTLWMPQLIGISLIKKN